MKSDPQALKAFCRFYRSKNNYATNNNWQGYLNITSPNLISEHIGHWINWFFSHSHIQINPDDATELAQNLIASIKQC